MSLFRLLILVSFAESFATICVERGVYFFCTERLGYTDISNLWLALAFGLAYALGAVMSHPVCRRIQEKPLLAWMLGGQMATHVAIGLAVAAMGWPVLAEGLRSWVSPVVFGGSTLLGWLNGMKWPVIESYVSAGKSPSQTAKAVGQFNISWCGAVPLALLAAGPLINYVPPGLFFLPAAINLLCLLLIRPLPTSPTHLSEDHPHRPDQRQLDRLASLLTASRWLMLGSYAALWVLGALLPRIFLDNLHLSVNLATGLSGLIDLLRLTAFVVFSRYVGWHNRLWPMALTLAVMPVGFFMVMFGPNMPGGGGAALAVVLAGEAVFGLMSGLIYYAALYYAMVVKNASVDAGGAHEGFIGMGFAIGPTVGLAGAAMSGLLQSQSAGIALGVAVMFAACIAGAGVAMRAAIRKGMA